MTIRSITLSALVALVWLIALMGGPLVRAQDLEPRSYNAAPVGLDLLVGGYGYTTGSARLDPSMPVEGLNIETHGGFLAYAHTLDVLGRSARLEAILPYASLGATGVLAGVPRERYVDGFADPLLRFSMLFIGAPALTLAEFPDFKQDFVLGGSLRVGIPAGQYNEDKVLNIGSNRWSLKGELGMSKTIGKWMIEVAPSVTFFTDNGQYLINNTREQTPLYSGQAEVSYSFKPGLWLAVGACYFNGAQSTIDDLKNDDRQEGLRLGATLSIPVNRHNSAKLYGTWGCNGARERDFRGIGIGWQYRWGGGL